MSADDRDPGASPAPAGPATPIWRKLVDAVRGGVSEIGEVLAESQALRILDQEIRDADADLRRARDALGERLAHYKVAQDRLAACVRQIDDYEGYALKALKAHDDTLARDTAARIAQLEAARGDDQAQVQRHAAGIADLRKAIAQSEANIRRLKQQVDTVRATESAQRAQAAVAHRHADGDARVRTALESLDRIKRRQAERGARIEAATQQAREPDADTLDARLRQAGIIEDDDSAERRADAVLARLKQRE